MDAKAIARFWSKVDKDNGPIIRRELGPCWIWIVGRDDCGYGVFHPTRDVPHTPSAAKKAHRVAFFLEHGEWPKCVLHHCDNPPCVRPSHLFAGTQRENMLDAYAKGRMKTPRGEAHYKARLTEEQVLEIRRRCTAGERQVEVAAAFGISQTTVSCIRRRASWHWLRGS